MPQNLRVIRRKVRTVQNICKITRAMYMVAAAKLRRLQGQVEAGRVYWDRLSDIIGRVTSQVGEFSHPLLESRDAESVAVLVIGGARGLCGSYNVSLLRHAHDLLEGLERPVHLMTVGVKAQQFFSRHEYEIEQAFETSDDEHRLLQATEIARTLRETFLSGSVGEVHVVFTRFVSALRHVPTTRQLLPIKPAGVAEESGVGAQQYIFEPPAQQLLGSLLPRSIDAMVYEMLLNSATAEEAARMTAMGAATDNADEMITTLTRELNRVRQAQITREILEVIAGADALTTD